VTLSAPESAPCGSQIENSEIRNPNSAIGMREAGVGKPKSNWELQGLLGNEFCRDYFFVEVVGKLKEV
jgi:hypothetical protein